MDLPESTQSFAVIEESIDYEEGGYGHGSWWNLFSDCLYFLSGIESQIIIYAWKRRRSWRFEGRKEGMRQSNRKV